VTNLSVNVQSDLTAIGLLANVPLVMVVNPTKGYKTVHDFVAAAKATPGSFTYGSGGRGDSTHLAAERFRMAAGFQGLYVPFRGAPEVLTEVMAGRLDFYMSPVAPAMSSIESGKLQALAVASGTRGITLPHVPTTTEAGFANSDYEFWVGAFAPAATPRAIVDRLNREVLRALETQSMRDRLKSMGGSPTPMTAQAFADQFNREVGVNAGLGKGGRASAELIRSMADMANKDLRDWIEAVKAAGELKLIKGAEPKEEIGGIVDIYMRKMGNPAVMFDDIPGYPQGPTASSLTFSLPRRA